MNIAAFQDTPFGDDDAFEDFLLANEVAHQTINEYLNRQGISINAIPIFGNPYENKAWLLDHQFLHQQIADALNLPAVEDLGDVDLTDPEAYADFMQSHAQEHAQISFSLGI